MISSNVISPNSGVSIIICCYNSEKTIKNTLTHIFFQKTSSNLIWEIILVDNNSNDDTKIMATETAIQYKPNHVQFKIIHEKKQGLSHARKTGVLSAYYDLILFCDDDNWLESDYLQNAYTIMSSNKSIGILGGENSAYFDYAIPGWFYSYADCYAVGTQGVRSGNVSKRGYIWGAGCVLRSSLIKYIYLHTQGHLLTGRSSVNLNAGDDSEISKWYLIAGYQLWFDEALKLTHYITLNRMNHVYLEKIRYGFQESSHILFAYDFLISLSKKREAIKNLNLRYLYRLIKSLFFYIKLPNAHKYEMHKICKAIKQYRMSQITIKANRKISL